MKLSSPAFKNGEKIPSQYTCDGLNRNPPLFISEVPPEAESLALIVEDPDVPANVREDGMWDHWLIFNMPADTREIKEGQEPDGIHGRGTSGDLKYFGPCPPDGEHRYFFKLFALDTRLTLFEGVSKGRMQEAMDGHIVGSTELMGLYERS
jgi:Raf kinase inhibitor-like YbhB/YbcL family protein